MGFDLGPLVEMGLGKLPAPAHTAQEALLKRYGHPAVLSDTNLNALHFLGDIGPYLKLTPGEPSHSIYRLAQKALRLLQGS